MLERKVVLMRVGQQVDAKTLVAYHEAGHAVADLAQGIDVAGVTIVPSGDRLGKCIFSMGSEWRDFHPDFDRSPKTVRRTKTVAVCFLGGPVAEDIVTDRWVLDGNEHDIREASLMLDHLCSSDEESEALLHEAWKRTKRLLRRHWAAVDAIAKALLEYNELDGRQVKALMCGISITADSQGQDDAASVGTSLPDAG